MAVVISQMTYSTSVYNLSSLPSNSSPLLKLPTHIKFQSKNFTSFSLGNKTQRRVSQISNKNEPELEAETHSTGVKVALSMLKFYKREISPILPKSCRYVPSCSEYSMIAYKKYGVAKGTILTGWRLCRCNPLGGSGFDPPRWFGEERASEPEE